MKAVFTFLLLATSLLAEKLPTLSAENLAGEKVVLPEAAHGKVSALVFGFTKKSQDTTRACADRLQRDLPSDSDIMIFRIAVLEDVPRLFRGFVKSGIRKGVPQQLHKNFLLLYEGEKSWKEFVGFDKPEGAYAVLLDGEGNVQWKSRGAITEAAFSPLEEKSKSLLAKSAAH